ncbi:MAG: DUF4405 domain-containing protein [Peptococcaceae bacterium]
MKPKAMLKVLVDIVMTAMILMQMAYHFTDNKIHEWMGATLFVLFILHHVLNWNWYKSLFKGRYTAVRTLHTAVNLLLTAAMAGLLASGMMLSREVFDFMHLSSGRLGRRLHMLSTSWGFVLISMHLGFHWGMVVSTVKRLMKKLGINSSYPGLAARPAAVLLSVYGIYAFITRQMWEKVLLLVEYAFFDFEEPVVFFFADYIAIMGLFACIAYYTAKLLRKRNPQSNLWQSKGEE